MRARISFPWAQFLSLLLALAPTALAVNTWYVDGVHGSDLNHCRSRQLACKTIGHAIMLSEQGDQVRIAPAIYRENLVIPHSLSLVGAGAATTILDGAGLGSVILNSQVDQRLFNLTVSNVTLRNGGGDAGNGVGDGGNIYNCFATLTVSDSILTGGRVRSGPGLDGYGGAIYNCPSSTLTIINTTIRGNSAEEGGAICNGGLLTILNSTLSGNTARHRKGGAIRNYGTLALINSTISGNHAAGVGGGIHNGALFGPSGTLFVSNTTLSGNIAAGGKGGGIFSDEAGTRVVLRNSIVANNSGENCHGILTSRGHNLSSDDSCSFSAPGDMNGIAPGLGPLRNNGGPTATHALLPGSPAIDAGNPGGCTDGHRHLLQTDQRGEPRPNHEDARGCDIGSFELQSD